MLPSPSSLPGRRFLIVFALLLGGVLADAVLNQLNVHALTDRTGWVQPLTFPKLGRLGSDLMIIRDRVDKIAHGGNPYASEPYPYPPFHAAFAYPFTLLSEPQAYVAQYWTLIILNLASVGLIAACLFRSSAPPPGGQETSGFPAGLIGIVVLLATVSLHFRSYSLEFSLERGNFDSYALFLSAAAVACMVFRPQWIWLPIILISAAVQLKVYPAILFALPLLQHRHRIILPMIVVNAFMLLSCGWEIARTFGGQLFAFMSAPFFWPGNHSIHSYVAQLIVPAFPGSPAASAAIQEWSTRGIALLVVGLWAHGMFRLRNLMPAARRWLLMAALAFPVMGALSSTSHDYKLVIYVVPLLVNLFVFSETFLAVGSVASVAGLALTLLCGVALNHSPLLGSWPFSETKFPALFLLFLLTYLQTYLAGETTTETNAAPVRRRGALALAIGAVAVVVLMCAHLVLKSRGDRFARLAAAKTTAAATAAPVTAPADPQAPDPAGSGAITVRLKLPDTTAGIPEPILVCGRPGSATMVYARVLPAGKIKIGVEFWGKTSAESDAYALNTRDGTITITCRLPCLFPERASAEWKNVPDTTQREWTENYLITVNDVVFLAGPITYPQEPHQPIYCGKNPLGGSLVSSEFTGKVLSAARQ